MGSEPGVRCARIRRVLGVAIVIQVLWVASPAVACDPPVHIDVVDAAAQPDVRGIVERRVVASNPLPWGRAVAVAVRVWGDVQVERWMVTDSGLAECSASPRRPSGSVIYERVPSGGFVVLDTEGAALSSAEEVALASRLGAPVSFSITSGDRAMAWLRVHPSVPFLVLVVLVFVTLLLRRRRVRRRDPYLF